MVEKIRIESIGIEDSELLKEFIDNSGNSTESFRYFKTRPLDVISNHLLTVIALNGCIPVGYGHLDQEADKIWFGIAISENYKGRGIGKEIMQYLIDYADKLNILELYLSVDVSNTIAIKMYEKFNFIKVKNLTISTLIMKRMCSNEI